MGMCWEGATTQRATARKVEQRPQRAPGRLSRACSAVTQQVNAFVGKKVNVYGHLQRKLSGQLPFLGSIRPHAIKSLDVLPGIGHVVGVVQQFHVLRGDGAFFY